MVYTYIFFHKCWWEQTLQSACVHFPSHTDRKTVKYFYTATQFALTDGFSWFTDILLSLSQRWLAGSNISYSLLMKSSIKTLPALLIPNTHIHTHTQNPEPMLRIIRGKHSFVGCWSNYFSEHSKVCLLCNCVCVYASVHAWRCVQFTCEETCMQWSAKIKQLLIAGSTSTINFFFLTLEPTTYFVCQSRQTCSQSQWFTSSSIYDETERFLLYNQSLLSNWKTSHILL